MKNSWVQPAVTVSMKSKLRAFSWIYLLLPCLIALVSCQSREEVKFRQYYVQGEQLYTKHCSNCHQKDGAGLGLLYPPLNRSDFMDQNFRQVICLMKHGRSGELTVNGKVFNQPMPGVPSLTELELAEIATFIYNSWSHNRGLVKTEEVKGALSQCR